MDQVTVPPGAATGPGDVPLLLMTPGPTRVPARVLAAGARPMIHHRTPAFSKILVSVVEQLRPLFGTSSADILPIHTTGRGAMEAAITNLFSPGDRIISCCNGKFGEMWAQLAESYGLVVERVCPRWGAPIDAAELEAALRAVPGARAVTIVQSDTSTGVQNDVAAVLAIARAHSVLGLVDCVSSLGGTRFAFDDWDADIAVTATQKCLMSSPGLAFVAVSERAWRTAESARLPRTYWDFGAVRASLGKAQPETPGTPPVHIFMQLAEALSQVHEEGFAHVCDRHEAMAALVRDRAPHLGLTLRFPDVGRFSPTVTALRTPAGMEPKRIRDALRRRGILIAGGLGDAAGDSVRIGHMGDIRIADVEQAIAALVHVLGDVAPGPSVAARA